MEDGQFEVRASKSHDSWVTSTLAQHNLKLMAAEKDILLMKQRLDSLESKVSLTNSTEQWRWQVMLVALLVNISLTAVNVTLTLNHLIVN